MNKRIAIFPGAFDPFTKGHLDLVERGRHIFDHLIIAVGVNSNKKRTVSLNTMIEKIEQLVVNWDNVEVKKYEGLTADFAQKVGAQFILRGIRNSTDLDYEASIANVNYQINSNLESVFLLSKPELSLISSSVVRDLIKYKQDISSYLPYEL